MNATTETVTLTNLHATRLAPGTYGVLLPVLLTLKHGDRDISESLHRAGDTLDVPRTTNRHWYAAELTTMPHEVGEENFEALLRIN